MPVFYHGRNTHFEITDSGSTSRDISNTLRSVSFPIETDVPETTAFGSTWKTFVVGILDGKFSIEGMFDSTTDGYLQGIFGQAAASPFIYGPSGGTAGLVKYTGSAYLVQYQIKGAVNEIVAATASFQVSGAVIRSTF